MQTRFCEFSPCRTYRYTLQIIWDAQLPLIMFIGLNPSTADETNDDPTVRRCIQFAKDFGGGRLVMTNIFAFRSTDPKAMLTHPGDVVGPENDAALVGSAHPAQLIICAWGKHGAHQGRGEAVRERIAAVRPLHCLRFNSDGSPAHPLYLPAKLRPVQFIGCWK